MAVTTGLPDHLWLSQLVFPSPGGGPGLGLGLSSLALMQATPTRGGPFMATDHLYHDRPTERHSLAEKLTVKHES